MMEYHAERDSFLAQSSLSQGYQWVLTAAENRMMMRLRGLRDGMHLMTVRVAEGEVAGIAVLTGREERVGID